MPTFLLRKVDDKLWRDVKARAASEGIPLRGLIVWMLAIFAKRGLSAFEAIDGKYPR